MNKLFQRLKMWQIILIQHGDRLQELVIKIQLLHVVHQILMHQSIRVQVELLDILFVDKTMD